MVRVGLWYALECIIMLSKLRNTYVLSKLRKLGLSYISYC